MILLKLHLSIQSNQPESALAASPFLGGVLHGTFEHCIRLHAPAIASELGMTQGSLLKQYSILPPPYGWHPPANSNALSLDCGILLYGKAKQYLKSIVFTLQHWREIRLKGRTDKITRNKIYICSPVAEPQLWCESDQNSIENFALNFNHTFIASDNIKIDLITPLILESDRQKEIGVNAAPPDLLRIVRSLMRRIQKLEPDLANSLGINSTQWIEAEEQIRHVSISTHALKQVRWQYGSRTKKRTILRMGLIGQVHYTGYVPATIVAALNWGCWFGIGQGTAMGQGMYTLSTSKKE